MLKKVKVRMTCIATVYINEDIQGNQEVDEMDDLIDIEDFEVIEEY